LNREQVLKRLPQINRDPGGEVAAPLNESCIKYLKSVYPKAKERGIK